MRARFSRPARLATGAAVTGALVAALASPAQAWPRPYSGAGGGACQADGTRGPVVWAATNLETAFPNSPAIIDNVHLVPAFPTTAFTPQPLQNTGSATATAIMTVPSAFVGTVYLDYRMFWDGPDGSDVRVGFAEITLDYCFAPALTTRQVRRLGTALRVRVRR